MERHLHQTFADKAMGHKWFNFSLEDLNRCFEAAEKYLQKQIAVQQGV
jgi:hypothetical protein